MTTSTNPSAPVGIYNPASMNWQEIFDFTRRQNASSVQVNQKDIITICQLVSSRIWTAHWWQFTLTTTPEIHCINGHQNYPMPSDCYRLVKAWLRYPQPIAGSSNTVPPFDDPAYLALQAAILSQQYVQGTTTSTVTTTTQAKMRGSGYATFDAANSITVAIPAGSVTGDLAVIIYSNYFTALSPYNAIYPSGFPSGWSFVIYGASGGIGGQTAESFLVISKVLTAADLTAGSVTLSGFTRGLIVSDTAFVAPAGPVQSAAFDVAIATFVGATGGISAAISSNVSPLTGIFSSYPFAVTGALPTDLAWYFGSYDNATSPGGMAAPSRGNILPEASYLTTHGGASAGEALTAGSPYSVTFTPSHPGANQFIGFVATILISALTETTTVTTIVPTTVDYPAFFFYPLDVVKTLDNDLYPNTAQQIRQITQIGNSGVWRLSRATYVPANQPFSLFGQYQPFAPKVIDLGKLLWMPDNYTHLAEAGILYYLYRANNDSRAGAASFAEGRMTYSGQLAVWMSGIESAAEEEREGSVDNFSPEDSLGSDICGQGIWIP